MILKFFKRGGTDDTRRSQGGQAVKDYLLGTENDPRAGARLLLGNPEDVTEIINGLTFAKVYTSGCLSFDESDVITEEQKYDIMADFEQMMFVGLEANRYCGYWVEHTDKGRLELNFVYPNVDLVTGKTLQVYYHARDLALVDAWKDLTNANYGLKDPNAAENRRIVAPTIAPQIMEGWEQSAKPKLLEKLSKYRDIDGFKQQLTDIILAQAVVRDEQNTPFTSQADIAQFLEQAGFTISRKGKDSISIKNPDPTQKNIKLKGALYDREVTAGTIRQLAQRSNPNRATNPTAEPAQRKSLSRQQEIYQREYHKRQERLKERHGEPTQRPHPPQPNHDQPTDRPANRHDEAQHRHTRAESDRFNPSERRADPTTNPDWANQWANTTSHHPPRERQLDLDSNHRGQPTTSHLRRPEQNIGGEQPIAPSPTPRHRTGTPTDLSNHEGQEPRAQQKYPYLSFGQNAPHRIYGVYFGWGVYHYLAIGRAHVRQLSRMAWHRPPSGQQSPIPATTRRENQQNPQRAETLDPDSSQTLSTGGDDRIQPSDQSQHHHHQRQTTNHAMAGQQNPISQAQGALHEQSANQPTHQQPTTHYREFKQAIERFIQPSDPNSQSAIQPATDVYRQPSQRVGSRTLQATIQAALDEIEPTTDRADPAAQPANNRLLKRIERATEIRNSNTQNRQGRIDRLTKPSKDRLDQIGQLTHQRQQRTDTILEKLTNLNDQAGTIHTRQLKRAANLTAAHQRLDPIKNDYANHADQLTSTTSRLQQLFGSAKAIGTAFKDKLTTAFGKLTKDIKGMDLVNTQTHKKLTSQEKDDLIHSHPFSMGWYDFLRSEMKQWKKRKTYENTPRL